MFVVAVAAVVALALFATPTSRGGAVAQLVRAADDAASAVRSAGVALNAWQRGRSTRNLTSVQLTDARDHVVSATGTVAELDLQNTADIERRRTLSGELNAAVDLLNSTRELVTYELPIPPGLDLARALRSTGDALSRYGS